MSVNEKTALRRLSTREVTQGKHLVTISIGEFHASAQPRVIETQVGSCIAVCLHETRMRIGGMNHVLVPGRADFAHHNRASYYAVNIMELLINRIVSLGGRRAHLTAKVFGGARMLEVLATNGCPGTKNARFLLEYLEKENIPVLASDLNGDNARHVLFHTDTGHAYVKRISRPNTARFFEQQRKALSKINRQMSQDTNVEFF
ncbi:MAG: chemotaxis protein CheD [Desulfatibacillaceae bacterium]